MAEVRGDGIRENGWAGDGVQDLGFESSVSPLCCYVNWREGLR